jgi:hypothetical protein
MSRCVILTFLLLVPNHDLKLISTPDLQIIDYGVGLPGSQHDATAWQETRVPQQHDILLQPNEWVWADSAYPLQKWCQAPYKAQVLYHSSTTQN